MGRATGSLIAALLAQSAPFLPPVLPDPLPVAAIALLMAALMPLTRDDPPRDGHSVLAAIAIALGTAGQTAFAWLAIVPVLLFDRRRFIVYGLGGGLGLLATLAFPAAAAMPLEAWAIILVVDLPIIVLLAAYVRLRRRGLMARDRRARLLTGILAAQALILVAGGGRHLLPALLLAGPALAMLWPMSRCIGATGLHHRLWLAGLVVLTVIRLAQTG
jgi:hypothetical protein